MPISTQQFVDALSHSGLLSAPDLATLQDSAQAQNGEALAAEQTCPCAVTLDPEREQPELDERLGDTPRVPGRTTKVLEEVRGLDCGSQQSAISRLY